MRLLFSTMPHRTPTHKPTNRRTKPPSEVARPSAHARGYDANWRRLRIMVLRERPLCENCSVHGLVVQATEIDHIDGDVRNLDESNLKPLCKPCHSTKTVTQDGGLGREVL
jgi:5-methylcytosine-specific restriction protein A